MAFPTIPTAGAGTIVSQLNTAGGATKTFTNILNGLTKSSGDLLLAICVIYDGNSTDAEFSGWTAGWTEIIDKATTTSMGFGIAYKISNGSETGNLAVTTADTSANDSAMIVMAISGAHASTAPEGRADSLGTTTSCRCNGVTPSWGPADTLWVYIGACGEDATTGSFTGIASTTPTNYSDLFETGISADVVGGIEAAVAFRQVNAATEDPNANGSVFVNDTSNARWRAGLVAIRPTAVAAFLDAAPGDFSLTGQDAAPVSGRVVSGSPASYALTGQAAGVPVGRAVLGSPGSYALTGAASSLPTTRILGADPGTYAVTGSQAGLLADRTVTASPGGFSFTGSQGDLVYGAGLAAYVLTADAGAYSLTGAAAGTLAARTLPASSVSYSLSGSSSSLAGTRGLDATGGSYVLTGFASGLGSGTPVVIADGDVLIAEAPAPVAVVVPVTNAAVNVATVGTFDVAIVNN